MDTDRSLYSVLGVSSRATADELRDAYRRLARLHHPDASDSGDAARMSEINHAWSVLSDPVTRREYDRLQHGGSAATGSAVPPSRDGVRGASRAAQIEPPRFPWRAMLIVAAVAAVVILVAHAFTEPPAPGVPDQLIQTGSCVQIDRENYAVEVSCAGPHAAVVEAFVAFDQTCPAETLAHLDRQGMGKACVRLVSVAE